jgi:drug/metabolite transporter (DMT)-like permease
VLLWSTAEVVVRTTVGQITPIQLSFIRFLIGGAFLLPFLPAALRRRNLRIDKRIVLHSMWMAWIGVVLNSLCYQYSLQWAGAGVVATMFGLSPLLTFFMAGLLLNEEMTIAKFAGLLVGFTGVGVLALSRASSAFSLLGLFLALASSACFALFTVLVKKVAGPFGGLPVTVFCALFGALYLAPMVAWEGRTEFMLHGRELALPVLYISVGTTGVAYLLYFLGLETVDATFASSALFLKPPLATALAALCLGEAITWNLAAAIVLILGGLYLVIFLNRRELTRKPATHVTAAP